MALRVQPTDLADLVRETCAALSTGRVPIRVEAPAELAVNLDANRIRHVLENMLANAIKHTPAGRPATATSALEEDEARAVSWAVVALADEGPGIPAELVPRLFDRFARGAGSTSLGLGLYLASRFAAVHGGTLVADPRPVSGARFSRKLPLAGPATDVPGG